MLNLSQKIIEIIFTSRRNTDCYQLIKKKNIYPPKVATPVISKIVILKAVITNITRVQKKIS